VYRCIYSIPKESATLFISRSENTDKAGPDLGLVEQRQE